MKCNPHQWRCRLGSKDKLPVEGAEVAVAEVGEVGSLGGFKILPWFSHSNLTKINSVEVEFKVIGLGETEGASKDILDRKIIIKLEVAVVHIERMDTAGIISSHIIITTKINSMSSSNKVMETIFRQMITGTIREVVEIHDVAVGQEGMVIIRAVEIIIKDVCALYLSC